MKVLHTSDIHIGKNLHKHKIGFAHNHFFDYIIEIIKKDAIDLLLISGDIFDTSYVSISTQKVFYEFLERLSNIKTLKDTVIISGNHDLASMLDLATPFLKLKNIHIITSTNIEKQIFSLKENNIPYCNIVAIPYLREKDIKPTLESNTILDIEKELETALINHFSKVEKYIEEKLDLTLPTISLMHLFATGSNNPTTIEGEKHRDIYVGKLKTINSNTFPKNIDYYALGHIHKPQIVNSKEKIVYCGSPITLNFGEKTTKQLTKLTFNNKTFEKQSIKLPKFLNLVQIKSTSIDNIKEQLTKIDETITVDYKDDPIYVEIIYNSSMIESSINEEIDEYIKELKNHFVVIMIKIESSITYKQTFNKKVSLENLTPKQIFEMTFKESDEEILKDKELMLLFNQVVTEVEDEAKKA